MLRFLNKQRTLRKIRTDEPLHQPHTLPSRTSRHTSQNLAKNVSVQPHDSPTNGWRNILSNEPRRPKLEISVIKDKENKDLYGGIDKFEFKNEHTITSNHWGINRVKFVCGQRSSPLNYDKVNNETTA